MKTNELLTQLQQIKGFDKPDVNKEQYLTPPGVAIKLLLAQEVQDKRVLDLGAGTGMLGIGALLLGAQHVTFIEVDTNATTVLKENLALFDIRQERYTIINYELLFTDVQADVTLMNPPFGTRNKHLDRNFLDYALTHSQTISTLHKTATKDFVHKRIAQLGATIAEEEEILYTLEYTMSHHTKSSEDIAVTRFHIKKL